MAPRTTIRLFVREIYSTINSDVITWNMVSISNVVLGINTIEKTKISIGTFSSE
jgi:hypothetical protein